MSIVYAKKNSEKNLKTVVFLSVFLLKEVKAELTHSFLTFDLLIRATLDTISNNKFISRERHSCSAILHCEQSLSTSTVHYTQKSKHKCHIHLRLNYYLWIPLLHVWNETKVNGPLGSVFSDCNSVLLTLNISDKKGKQKIPVSKVVKLALIGHYKYNILNYKF